jgi:hypothetical protein
MAVHGSTVQAAVDGDVEEFLPHLPSDSFRNSAAGTATHINLNTSDKFRLPGRISAY